MCGIELKENWRCTCCLFRKAKQTKCNTKINFNRQKLFEFFVWKYFKIHDDYVDLSLIPKYIFTEQIWIICDNFGLINSLIENPKDFSSYSLFKCLKQIWICVCVLVTTQFTIESRFELFAVDSLMKNTSNVVTEPYALPKRLQTAYVAAISVSFKKIFQIQFLSHIKRISSTCKCEQWTQRKCLFMSLIDNCIELNICERK